MKKIIVLSLMAVMLLCFTACGDKDLSSSKYVGSWRAASVAIGDETGEFSDEIIMTLNGDGTGTMSSGDETSSFTWQLTDNGFKTKGDVKMKFTDDGDNIKSKILGVDVTFTRS